jgi:hypothetical protein
MWEATSKLCTLVKLVWRLLSERFYVLRASCRHPNSQIFQYATKRPRIAAGPSGFSGGFALAGRSRGER